MAEDRAAALRRRAYEVAEFLIPRPAANTLGARGVAGLNSILPGGGTYDEELERYNATAPSSAEALFSVVGLVNPPAKAGASSAAAATKVAALRRKAGKLAKLGNKQGGFTFPPVKSGFAFSESPANEQIVTKLSAEAIRRYVKEHADSLGVAGAKLGAWSDGQKWYLDVSTVLPERTAALKAAAKAKQLAIYDLAKGESINVP